MSYLGAEGLRGCVAAFAAARAGLGTTAASSVTGTWPEAGLTVASLLACSVYKMRHAQSSSQQSCHCSISKIFTNSYSLDFLLPCPCTDRVQHLTFGFPALALLVC